MALDEPFLDDDYVLNVLIEESKKSTLRHTRLGDPNYVPQPPPKPNTRFLTNLIKSTDSHNTALRRAEQKAARARESEQNDHGRRKRSRSREHRPSRRRRSSRGEFGDGGVRSRSRGGRHYKRRNRDEARSEGKEERARSHERRHHRHHDRSRSRSPHKERRRRSSPPSHSDRPQTVTVRGRNAHHPLGSSMDSRFKVDPPNPSTHERVPSSYEDDVEAFRSRQKMKAEQISRLREADWDEDRIEQWQRNAAFSGEAQEVDISQIKWKGRGTEREWDRGKGGASHDESSYGRLKGT